MASNSSNFITQVHRFIPLQADGTTPLVLLADGSTDAAISIEHGAVTKVGERLNYDLDGLYSRHTIEFINGAVTGTVSISGITTGGQSLVIATFGAADTSGNILVIDPRRGIDGTFAGSLTAGVGATAFATTVCPHFRSISITYTNITQAAGLPEIVIRSDSQAW